MLYSHRSTLLNRLGRYEEARRDLDMAMIKTCDQAIESDPKDMEAYHNRGLVKHRLNDLPGACADWKRALELGFEQARELLEAHCR